MNRNSTTSIKVGYEVEIDHGHGFQLLGELSSTGPQMSAAGRDQWVAHAQSCGAKFRVTEVTTTTTTVAKVL